MPVPEDRSPIDRAQVLLEAGKPEDALALILPYLASHPDDFDVLTTAAQAYLSLD
jgi:predicted Zn-dependent protease